MKAGRKRHVVWVIRQPDELDQYGKEKPAQKLFRIRCNCQIISASNYIASGASLTSEYVSILARYDRRLLIDDQLEWRGNMYEIEMIKPDEKLYDMIVTCVRKDSV